MATPPSEETTLTIGQLSQMTGIGTHTLRVWEKRYGSPTALRLPSGHRRYPKDEVPRLRAVARALDAGYRASRVVPQSLKKLESLLGDPASDRAAAENEGPDAASAVNMDPWIHAALFFDEQGLTEPFFAEWGRRGPLAFIKDCAVPFMVEVGNRWEEGSLSVSQEHFASEKLCDFLSSQWRKLNERNTRGPFVITTLPDDSHRVGLHMCSVVTALADRKVISLGPDTPLSEIIATVERCRAKALVMSIPVTLEPKVVKKALQIIRDKLPDSVDILIGGAGAPEPTPGIQRFTNFDDYYLWLGKTS